MQQPRQFRGVFRLDDDARAVYAEAAGITRAVPFAVAVPIDAEDTAVLMSWAREVRIPLIPRGSGSSMAGGAVGEGVIVDLRHLRGVTLSDDWVQATVGPGTTLGALNQALAPRGRRFPVDPSSAAFCTLGGMASTNAAGARTLRFGATRAWVTGIECVFADGTRTWIRRGAPVPNDGEVLVRWIAQAAQLRQSAASLALRGVRKDSSGYALRQFAESGELIDLLVGSEGTLALFTSLEVATVAVATSVATLLAAYDTLEGAARGAAIAREAGADACELLDQTLLELASEHAEGGERLTSSGETAEALLLIAVEGFDDDAIATRAESLGSSLRGAGARAVDVALGVEASERLWEYRHLASPILNRLDPPFKSMQFVEDGAVPPEHFAEYVRGIRTALDRQGLRGVIFGHAGDAHAHVNPLVDVREPDWRSRVDALFEEVVALTARLGGTLAGEHGDGRMRTPLLDRVWDPESRRLFARLKQCFDPEGLLNPGVKIALRGQRALDDIKYDPALEPLPPRARQVLDTIVKNRAWDADRLEMLSRTE